MPHKEEANEVPSDDPASLIKDEAQQVEKAN
jgi:hypothetical protein